MQVAECPHTMGSALGAKFVSQVLPLPLLGDGSCSGATVKWIENSAMAAWFDKSDIYSAFNGVVQRIIIKAWESGK